MGEEIIKLLVRFSGAVAVIMLLVTLPLTLWLTWSHRDGILSPLVATLFMCSVGWAAVSAIQTLRSVKKLGLTDSKALFSGARPSDPDELRVWRWGWQFGYAVIAALLFLILIPIVGSMILG